VNAGITNKYQMDNIKKTTMDFLLKIKDNNTREWFVNNRELYNDARENFELIIRKTINQITVLDPIFKGLDAKDCIFRINRDIRFSNDKSPYKTHFGAFIVRGGKKNGDKFAGYYIHLEPGNSSIIAGGAYLPPAPWLKAIREKIDEEPEKLLRIINKPEFLQYFGKIDGDRLKTAPKGYSPDHPYIDLLKFKSFLAVNEVPDSKVLNTDYFNHILNVVRAIKPFNDFLNDY
jgi:uncharacterized protein (TIGR02453 family)